MGQCYGFTSTSGGGDNTALSQGLRVHIISCFVLKSKYCERFHFPNPRAGDLEWLNAEIEAHLRMADPDFCLLSSQSKVAPEIVDV